GRLRDDAMSRGSYGGAAPNPLRLGGKPVGGAFVSGQIPPRSSYPPSRSGAFGSSFAFDWGKNQNFPIYFATAPGSPKACPARKRARIASSIAGFGFSSAKVL